MPSPCPCRGCKAAYEVGYREGYNDHARSRAYAEAVYGRYNPDDPSCTGRDPHMCGWNPHGKGENP